MIDSFEEKLIEKVKKQNWFHLVGVSSDEADDPIISINQVKEICQQMKEQMYVVYEDNSDKMQVKLQKLSEVLESCTKFNHELLEASRALGCLREDLAINQEIKADRIVFIWWNIFLWAH